MQGPNMMHMCKSSPNLRDSPEAGRLRRDIPEYVRRLQQGCASRGQWLPGSLCAATRGCTPSLCTCSICRARTQGPATGNRPEPLLPPQQLEKKYRNSVVPHACNATQTWGTYSGSISTGTWAHVPSGSMTPRRPSASASLLPGRPGGHPREAAQPASHSISRA